MEYLARLSFLHLHILERRRLMADLILIQRIIFGSVEVNMADCFLLKTTALQLAVITISCLLFGS